MRQNGFIWLTKLYIVYIILYHKSFEDDQNGIQRLYLN